MGTRPVVFLCTSDNIGGMERIVCNLARRFTLAQTPVRTIVPTTLKSEALLDWCLEQGVSAVSSPVVLEADAPHSWGLMLKLAGFLKSLNAGVVNFHYGSNFVSIKDILGAKLGGASAIYATLHMAEGWDQLGEQKKNMTRLAARHLTKFIAISIETENLLLEAGVPPAKIERIYCGVRTPEPTSRKIGRARFGIPGEAFVVVTAARLVPTKGVLELVKACAEAQSSCPNLYLLIAGDGSERLPLEKVAQDLLGERVQFLGTVKERMEDVYAAGDIFALPSSLEGLPLVYIEAAMQSVPSVASNAGGTREVVIDGETGVIIPPRDEAACAAAIVNFYADKNLRAAMGAAAKNRALTQFTEERMAAEYRRLFGMRD